MRKLLWMSLVMALGCGNSVDDENGGSSGRGGGTAGRSGSGGESGSGATGGGATGGGGAGGNAGGVGVGGVKVLTSMARTCGLGAFGPDMICASN